MVAVLNLKPQVRNTLPALHIITVCADSDCKAVGMAEVLNGGTTSLGAQIRAHAIAQKMKLRDPTGFGSSEHDVDFRAVAFTGDFPEMASMLPAKGSTSAWLYDRLSNIDSRTKEYVERKSFSLLREGMSHVTSHVTRDSYTRFLHEIVCVHYMVSALGRCTAHLAEIWYAKCYTCYVTCYT